MDISDKSDIPCDLRRGIPFPRNTVHKIYSSHFMEHLPYKFGQRFLAEALRVLVPGGVFSICVPNARIYIEAYLNPSIDISDHFVFKPAYHNTNSRIDFVNYMAYMNNNHHYLFDEENLINLLKLKGFQNVKLRNFEPGLDMEARDFESIYAEAIK